MSDQQLHQVRQRLEDALAGLGQRTVPGLELSAGDVYERALSELEMDLAVEAINVRSQTAKEVRSALRRLGTSDYGICESCGEPIGSSRLRALPWARRCIRCQSATDATAAGGRIPKYRRPGGPDWLVGGIQ